MRWLATQGARRRRTSREPGRERRGTPPDRAPCLPDQPNGRTQIQAECR